MGHTMLAQSPLVVAPPLQGGSSTSHRPSSSVDGHRRRVSMPITPPETPDRSGFSGAQTVPTHYVETLPTPPESPASAKSFATQATQGVLSLATDAWQNEKQQWSHKARGHSRVLSYGDALAPTASYTRIAQRSLFTPSRVITVTLIIFTTVYAILLIVPPIRSRAEVAQATKSPLVALATPEVRPAKAAAALAANEPNESLDGYRAVERSSTSTTYCSREGRQKRGSVQALKRHAVKGPPQKSASRTGCPMTRKRTSLSAPSSVECGSSSAVVRRRASRVTLSKIYLCNSWSYFTVATCLAKRPATVTV